LYIYFTYTQIGLVFDVIFRSFSQEFGGSSSIAILKKSFLDGGNHLEPVNSGSSHLLDGYLSVTSSPQIGTDSIFLTVVSTMFNKLLISRPTIAMDPDILSTVCLDSIDAQAANRGGNCDTFSTVNPDNNSHHQHAAVTLLIRHTYIYTTIAKN